MNYSELVGYLLKKRGYNTQELQDRFLYPDYDRHTYDPFLMSDMEIAVERILQTIQNDEKICVYSDYDADGIPGATILHDFFKKIKYLHNVTFYIPHRHDEGYGLHIPALEKIKNEGVVLLITVDLGITAVKEVDFANSIGLEVIITDHHEPLEELPNAVAVINPKVPKKQSKLSDNTYPDTMLCGCATAFKLIQGILMVLRSERILENNNLDLKKIIGKTLIPPIGWEKWLLDMVGIATLSDMVPLVNENRVFAIYGLRVLRKTRRPGLLALFQIMKIRQAYLTEDDVVFSITPRLNAASRMAHPEVAFQLLTTDDSTQARDIALELSRLNDERKLEVARAMKEVHKKMSARSSLPKIIVTGDPSWSAGVLGLIASKIVDEYDRTVFVWGTDGELVKGSCRARDGDHVVDLMTTIANKFDHYGGHEGAGGFSMKRENVHFLEDELNAIAGEVVHNKNESDNSQEYDIKLYPEQVTYDLYKQLQCFAPFGLGNRSPLVCIPEFQPEKVQVFGKTKEHLEIVVTSGIQPLRAIQFFTKPERYGIDSDNPQKITLFGNIEYSFFMGKGELRMRIIDVLRVVNE